MGRPSRELTPMESARHFFGAELRHWRTLRGLSQARLGGLTHDSAALISKVEKGERYPSRDLAERLDGALATGGVLQRQWSRVEQERAARNVTSSGMSRDDAAPLTDDFGLGWALTPRGTVEVVRALWIAELERRPALLSVTWAATAVAEPVYEWLVNRQDEVRQNHSGRRVGPSDIETLWRMADAFTDADRRLGGGYARSTLTHYVNERVLPLLQGSYDDTIGRKLMAAAARLCDLCAFMSFDSGQQGLAQRYFIQALRLAQASENRALGAHILADMSMQAHHLGYGAHALTLADAGYRTGLDCGSPTTAARCAAMQGRAHSLRGDQRACAEACSVAERALNRAVPADEPSWVRFFTFEQLSAEMLYMAGDLVRHKDVQRLASVALATSKAMGRRQVLCTSTLAASYLSADVTATTDVQRACDLMWTIIPSLASLRSARTLDRVNSVRRVPASHNDQPCVQEFEDRLRASMTAGA